MSPVSTQLETEWRSLMATHARVKAALQRELQREHRLSVAEFEALDRIAGVEAGCRLQALTEEGHMSQSALSRLVGRLADEGLVVRKVCENDRRGIDAYITEAGLERLAAARPTYAAVLEQTLR